MAKKECESFVNQIMAHSRELNKIEGRISAIKEIRESLDHARDIITITRTDDVIARLNEKSNDTKKNIDEFVDMLIDCECGELKEVQLKVPIMISETVEKALKESGYDVGTDAYYEDPDKFVSVIVRPTKELELRSGG